MKLRLPSEFLGKGAEQNEVGQGLTEIEECDFCEWIVEWLFWNLWNYWCLEGTRNHQRVLTMMSWIRRDIKPLLQHNSGNNLIFVPWLQSVEAVYVDGSQESNTFFSSRERTTWLRSVWNTGSSSNIPKEWNALKRLKEVSGLHHKLTAFTLEWFKWGQVKLYARQLHQCSNV